MQSITYWRWLHVNRSDLETLWKDKSIMLSLILSKVLFFSIFLSFVEIVGGLKCFFQKRDLHPLARNKLRKASKVSRHSTYSTLSRILKFSATVSVYVLTDSGSEDKMVDWGIWRYPSTLKKRIGISVVHTIPYHRYQVLIPCYIIHCFCATLYRDHCEITQVKFNSRYWLHYQ